MARSGQRSVEREKYWRGLVDEQCGSGLSVRAFCQGKEIPEPSFYAWRKKLRQRDRQDASRAGNGQRLIPVSVVEPPPERSGARLGGDLLEITTPEGFTLRFREHTSADTVCRLLDVVRQAGGQERRSC